MWYKTGTVTYKAGSALIIGKDTMWADDKMGITPGDLVLISITDDNVMMAEIKSVNSNTEIELRTAFNKDSVTDTKYAIINTLNETIADFAKRIAAAIAYFNEQAKSIQDLESRVQSALKQFLPKGNNVHLDSAQNTLDLGVGSTDIYLKNGSTNKYLQLKNDGRLTYSDQEVYHTGRKPTPAEIGALPTANPVMTGTPTVSHDGWPGYRIQATNTLCPPSRRFTLIEKTREGTALSIITRGEDGKNDGIITIPAGQSGEIYHTGRKPTIEEIGAAPWSMGNRYTIDTRGLNKDWFYPISFNTGNDWPTTRLTIKSTARGGADPFNQNSFVGFVSASGWSDTPQIVSGVLSYYDANERTLGGIFAGQRDFYGFVVYVRGDNIYNIESQTAPTLHKTQVSLGTSENASVFPVGAVVSPTNANLLLDLKTATHGFHCNRDLSITGHSFFRGTATYQGKIQLDSKANNTLQLAIGDNDSGFGFRTDGAVNLWSNNAIKGYFDPTQFVYNQFASQGADAFRAVYGGKGFLMRQDGANMYFLLATDNAGWGGWNTYRPMVINMTDGTTTFGCPTHLNGATYYNSTQYWKRINGAGREANLRLWGSGARETVLEWGWAGLPYGMYLERNTGLANNQSMLSVNGQIRGQVVNSSDARLKHNVQKVEGALDIVEKLNGYTFQYNETDVPSAGVIAQELLEVYGNAVFVGNNPNNEEDEEDYYTVDYNQLHALHIEAIKELSAQNRQLKADNETLRATLELLQSNVKMMIDERVQVLEMKLDALYNDKMNGVSTEAPPINTEETP